MRKTSAIRSVIFVYVVLAILMIGAVLTAALYMTHITTIIRPDGQVSSSDWPQQYAEGFEEYITYADHIPQVSDDGLASLERNHLWIQFLDHDGNQTFEYNKPAEIPDSYTFNEVLQLSADNQLFEYTVFYITADDDNNMGYLIGFPIDVSKTTLFYNGGRYTGSRPLFLIVLIGFCILILLAGLLYGAWLTRHLSRIVKSSGRIAARAYSPIHTRGVFGDAYQSLNKLDSEISASDNIRKDTDRIREEWIINITHDIKTPLSPIKGYAELLADGQCNPDQINSYGQIILKNANYTEQLINDLKLTYQIESGTIPLNIQNINLVRQIKELVIELLNNTDYSDRALSFICEEDTIYANLDMPLFRRAVTNIIVNALTHNSPPTEVVVSLAEEDDGIILAVSDNGKGINEAEINNLFTRFYRGANTDQKPEGSGLGLAIAKQIVGLHDGEIEVQSIPGTGTSITIHLPSSQK